MMSRVITLLVWLQMMKKAEEATSQVQKLLQKSLENWLPGWMEERYEKVLI